MQRTIRTCLSSALILVASAALFSGYAAPVSASSGSAIVPPAKPGAHDFGSNTTGGASIALPMVKKRDVEKEIRASDKPVVTLGTAADCRDCASVEQVLAKLALEYPGIRFVMVDGPDFGVSADRMPAIATALPKYSATSISRRFNVVPDGNLEAYLRARVEAVAKIAALDNEARGLSEQTLVKVEALKALYDDPKEEERLQRADLAGQLADMMHRQSQIITEIGAIIKQEVRDSTVNQ
ncbi:MAG: thioredoxin family protein [Candidatus Obscuribacter sp.]|nr:thioredoxin family protein [Candidatus Obscuribacter sp.]